MKNYDMNKNVNPYNNDSRAGYGNQPSQFNQGSNLLNHYPPVTLKEWLIIFLLMCLPVANIVLLISWASSSEVNPSKASWAKATLIWMGISFAFAVLYILFIMVIITPSFRQMLSQ